MKINKSELLSALDIVTVGVNNNASITNSVGNILFYQNHLYAFDGRIVACTPFPSDLEGYVSGPKFINAINACPEEFTMNTTDKSIVLTTESGVEIGLSLISQLEPTFIEMLEQYQETYENAEDTAVTVPVGFSEALGECAEFTAKDFSDGLLQCVLVSGDTMYATNKNQIIQCTYEEFPLSFLIYGTSAKKIAETTRIDTVCVQKDYIIFTFVDGGYCITQKVGDASEYPEIGQYFDTFRESGTLIACSDTYKDTLATMSKFADDKSTQVIHVALTENLLKVNMRNVSGWIKNDIEVSYEGEPQKFVVNFHQFLQSSKTGDDLIITEGAFFFCGKNKTVAVAVRSN